MVFPFVVVTVDKPLLPLALFEKIHEMADIEITLMLKPPLSCLLAIFPASSVIASFVIVPVPFPVL